MTRNGQSRNALDGKIINLRWGLAVFITTSPYYRVRIGSVAEKRVVKTSKATTRAEAITVAEELFSSMGTRGALAETPDGENFSSVYGISFYRIGRAAAFLQTELSS